MNQGARAPERELSRVAGWSMGAADTRHLIGTLVSTRRRAMANLGAMLRTPHLGLPPRRHPHSASAISQGEAQRQHAAGPGSMALSHLAVLQVPRHEEDNGAEEGMLDCEDEDSEDRGEDRLDVVKVEQVHPGGADDALDLGWRESAAGAL